MLQINQSVTRNTKWAMLLETWCRLDRHTSDLKHSCRKQYLRIDNRIGETRMAEWGLWSRSSRSLSSHSHICICCQLVLVGSFPECWCRCHVYTGVVGPKTWLLRVLEKSVWLIVPSWALSLLGVLVLWWPIPPSFEVLPIPTIIRMRLISTGRRRLKFPYLLSASALRRASVTCLMARKATGSEGEEEAYCIFVRNVLSGVGC